MRAKHQNGENMPRGKRSGSERSETCMLCFPADVDLLKFTFTTSQCVLCNGNGLHLSKNLHLTKRGGG